MCRCWNLNCNCTPLYELNNPYDVICPVVGNHMCLLCRHDGHFPASCTESASWFSWLSGNAFGPHPTFEQYEWNQWCLARWREYDERLLWLQRMIRLSRWVAVIICCSPRLFADNLLKPLSIVIQNFDLLLASYPEFKLLQKVWNVNKAQPGASLARCYEMINVRTKASDAAIALLSALLEIRRASGDEWDDPLSYEIQRWRTRPSRD